MAADVPRHLTPTGGMTDQHNVFQIELFDDLRKIVRVGVQFVAVPGLARPAVAATVSRDRAVAIGGDKDHLVVPHVGIERPAVAEDDRLAGSPVLVEDLGAVLGGDPTRAHGGGPPSTSPP